MESIKAKASGQYFGHKLNVARTRKTEEHTQWRFKAKAIADNKTEERQSVEDSLISVRGPEGNS